MARSNQAAADPPVETAPKFQCYVADSPVDLVKLAVASGVSMATDAGHAYRVWVHGDVYKYVWAKSRGSASEMAVLDVRLVTKAELNKALIDHLISLKATA